MLEFLLGAALASQADTSRTPSLAHDASDAARRAGSRAEALQIQVDRLTLFAMALAELLAERGGMTEELILDKVQEIDLRDGRRDARARPKQPPQPCPACKRVLAAYHVHCIYCGAERPGASPSHYLGR